MSVYSTSDELLALPAAVPAVDIGIRAQPETNSKTSASPHTVDGRDVLDAPSDRLARILVDTGTEVNSVQRIADGAIVARIKSLEKVAEARKSITIATLDVGAGEPVVVLTAATLTSHPWIE